MQIMDQNLPTRDDPGDGLASVLTIMESFSV